jgi:hypothetical protein
MGLAWAVLGCLTITLAASSAQAQVAPGRLARDIRVMERALDEMLIDSPNFFVSGRGNTRGMYLEGHGALFTFQATLVNKDWDFDFESWKGLDFEVKDEGDKIVIYRDKGKGKHETPEPPEPPETPDPDEGEAPRARGDREPDAEVRRNMRHQMMQRDEKLYSRGKQEMVDFLLDFGDAIDGLRDDEWITLVAYLRDHEYFETHDISNFSVKAKMADLRAYADGKLDEKQMLSRLVQSEY